MVQKIMKMLTICRAEPHDAEEILVLQKLAYQSEARLYNEWNIPPLTQSLDSLKEEFADYIVLKALTDGRIVGSVRAKITDGCCAIGRLIVHPDFQGRGVGSRLLAAIEAEFPKALKFELFTGSKSEANIRLYQRYGYLISRTQQLSPAVLLVFLAKSCQEDVS
jgi:ribosomal protein S18 acetylase RimI-like enzyme